MKIKITETENIRILTLHRVGKPSFISIYGDEYWYKHGLHHRDNEPAVTLSIGTKVWFKNGVRHRFGGPAIIYSDGSMGWYENREFIKREDN